MRRYAAFLVFVFVGVGSAPAQPVTYYDPIGDTAIRLTDVGCNGDVNPTVHAVPDITACKYGNWQPDVPDVDLYTGQYTSSGQFFRMDVSFAGVINPPGPLAILTTEYDPYRYGDNPVLGYVEIDVDANVNTGGETAPWNRWYTSNVARFGGRPAVPRFNNRIAENGSDIDQNLQTPPYVERNGEEFHVCYIGDLIQEFAGDANSNGKFDSDEIWIIRGKFFHRAHAFEAFSGAGGDGIYQPVVSLRFAYDSPTDRTTVTLVYPLTNIGAAQMEGPGVPPEPMDGNDWNQNSIKEGLQDLKTSVQMIPPHDPRRYDPAFQLIAGWENEDPGSYLQSEAWNVVLCVAMAYGTKDSSGALFSWTDVWPSPVVGDFNGNGVGDLGDLARFNQFISNNDGISGKDADGQVNGSVALPGICPNFSMFDLNYDGLVNDDDRQLIVIMGDMDGDLDIDMEDVNIFAQVIIGLQPPPVNLPPNVVQRGDFNGDGRLDGGDIEGFVKTFLAPPSPVFGSHLGMR